MSATYTIDDSITTLLSSQADVSREDCDVLARSLLSSTPTPVAIQGAFSYTVEDNVQLVQFRACNSPLHIDVLERAKSIHGRLIAETTYHGTIGQGKPLSVYVIEKLPGITYLEFLLKSGLCQSLDKAQYRKQQALVEDLARFFAASWTKPQAVDTAAMRRTFENDLQLLAESLPRRFSKDITNLIHNLESITDSLFPVLTHGDLCEMNFLVDEDSGRLTGVIDWAEAGVLPPGFSLWALENVLGYMDVHGWHYFDQHVDLRALFWKTLNHAIAQDNALMENRAALDLARQLGLLFRYAFSWDGDMRRGVVGDGDSGTRYLDAFFLGNT